jgi:regulator of nucleoside diphosphate kinase
MNATKNKLVLKKSDYDLLIKYVFSRMSPMSAENKNAEQLYQELQNAEVHEDDDPMPGDVIQLNSTIVVQEDSTGRHLKFRLVLPGSSNLSQERLSLYAPLGIALIGYRAGQTVSWEMPSGKKVFHIREVVNG